MLQEWKDKVVSLYEQGNSLRDIGDDLEMSHETVRKILKEAGVLMKDVGRPPSDEMWRSLSNRGYVLKKDRPNCLNSGYKYLIRVDCEEGLVNDTFVKTGSEVKPLKRQYEKEGKEFGIYQIKDVEVWINTEDETEYKWRFSVSKLVYATPKHDKIELDWRLRHTTELKD